MDDTIPVCSTITPTIFDSLQDDQFPKLITDLSITSPEQNTDGLKDCETNIPYYLFNKNGLDNNDAPCFGQSTERPEKNIPLLIKDILRLKINAENGFGKNLSAYGKRFETVMVYGNCLPISRQSKLEQMIYTLDDGTGQIKVKYPLRNQFTLPVCRYREDLNHQFNDKNNTDENLCLDRILKKIENQINWSDQHIRTGSQVCVIGVPYMVFGKNCLYAYEINVDDSQNREKELFYKRNLIRYYTSHFINRPLNTSRDIT